MVSNQYLSEKFINCDIMFNVTLYIIPCIEYLRHFMHGWHSGLDSCLTTGLGHFGRGHLGRGHYGSGHLSRGHYSRGHLSRGHYGRGHLGRGHYGRGHFGRGHLGRGHFGPLIQRILYS